MQTLWIYGDSFAEDHNSSQQWLHQLKQLSNIEQLQVHALAGSANDWISMQILNTSDQWQEDDVVIVIPTQANRQWWFEDHPHMSNINSMWGHAWARELEADNKHRVDAVGYYMNFLQRDDIDTLRCRQMTAWVESVANAKGVTLRMLPAFDLGFSIRGCEGNLTDVCNSEFFDRRVMERHYQQGVDSRVNHLSPVNHEWLANALYTSLVNNIGVDLTQGYQSGFLT